MMREKITVSGDIPLRNKDFLNELRDVYQPMFNNRINVDLMNQFLLKDEPWFVQTISEEQKIVLRDYMSSSGNSDFTSSLVKLIYDTFPKQNEEILHVKQRCDLIRMFLNELI